MTPHPERHGEPTVRRVSAKPETENEAATTLSFARPPGVEWAFESFDWSDPQAAFRRIAPLPSGR